MAIGIITFGFWAIGAQAPKGDRTIAQLKLPDGHEFVVHHYRHGWFEYPKVRFYARDPKGIWTSFPVYAELVVANATSLETDESAQQVQLMSNGYWVNTYVIQDGSFTHVDGPGSVSWTLPPGVEPGEEENIH